MIREAILREKKKNKIAVIIYTILGYPNVDLSLRALEILKKYNITIYETAVPISSGYSPDLSKVIKIAHKKAYQNGISPKDVVETFSFYRPNLYIIHEGTPSYILDFLVKKNEKIDGILIGLNKKETKRYYEDFMSQNIEVVQEISLKLKKEEIRERVKLAQGFVYLTIAERTGGSRYLLRKIERMINAVKEIREDILICCGFGIKDPQDITEVGSLEGCDGIIIGTAALDSLSGGLTQFNSYINAVGDAAMKIRK